MKPVAFDYVRPSSVSEACGLLAADDGARVIAGGQTLIPMLAMRLARPTRLVDISRIADLAFIRDDADAVTIGAVTRQCVAERDPIVATQLPLLAKALPWVGHRSRRWEPEPIRWLGINAALRATTLRDTWERPRAS